MSPLKEGDGDEGWNWSRGEDDDTESAYTTSEEPTVPLPLSSATKARIRTGSFSESIISGFYASVSTGHSFFPPAIPGSLENRVTGCHDLSGSFRGGGGATESTTVQATVRSR